MKPLVCACAAVFVAAASLPAQAETAAGLQTKIDGALAAVSSFVVTTQYPTEDYASTLVYVKPDRSRLATAFSANTNEIVTIGRTVYRSHNGSTFERSTVAANVPAPSLNGIVKVTAVGPDVHEGKSTLGSFTASVTFDKPYDLTCTYEKTTYRPLICTSSAVTQTYDRYDDPGNIVDAPAHVVDAPAATATAAAH